MRESDSMKLVNIMSVHSGFALASREKRQPFQRSVDRSPDLVLQQDQFTNRANERWLITCPNADGCVEIVEDRPELPLRLAAVHKQEEDTYELLLTHKSSSALADEGQDPASILWRLELDPKSGYYIIRSSARSSLVLDVCGGSVDQNAAVIVWGHHGGSNQLWRIVPTQRVLMPIFRHESFLSLHCARDSLWLLLAINTHTHTHSLSTEEMEKFKVDFSEIDTKLRAVVGRVLPWSQVYLVFVLFRVFKPSHMSSPMCASCQMSSGSVSCITS